jgi:hypothetical protein
MDLPEYGIRIMCGHKKEGPFILSSVKIYMGRIQGSM